MKNNELEKIEALDAHLTALFTAADNLFGCSDPAEAKVHWMSARIAFFKAKNITEPRMDWGSKALNEESRLDNFSRQPPR